MNKERLLSYLAGYFDGEGCVSVSVHHKGKYNYLSASMIFTQCNREACEMFLDVLGVGKIYEIKPRKAHHKTVWQWRANGKAALTAGEILYPFLIFKRDQIMDKIIVPSF